MIFWSTNKSELSIISKRVNLTSFLKFTCWNENRTFFLLYLWIERLTSIADDFCYLCFLIGDSCMQTERNTETGLRFYCWENQVAILSQFSFLSVIINSNRTASRRSTKTNILFFDSSNFLINWIWEFWFLSVRVKSTASHQFNITTQKENKSKRRKP